ncbi:hypothetical protein [Rhodoferax sp.]|uniref:hypothetical protein n=1 Tax=Rhodoferax sp. TaxID=50421 RepID=UPI00274F18AC|nr:hypothetical protein [Rhodoferax sp.]
MASGTHSIPLLSGVIFDGKTAISVAHSRDSQPWWAGVPCEQPTITEPIGVPVATIKAHFLRSRHLHVGKGHLHNGTGMTTEWKKDVDWNDALSLMPVRPDSLPVQFDLELDALDRVLVAAGESEAAGALNGILLDMTTGRLVGCDGHRLHMFDRKVPKQSRKNGQGSLHVLVPRAAAKWLLYSADEKAMVQVWGMGTEQPLVMMRTSDGVIYTKAIVGKYPDYMRIMPNRPVFRLWARLNPAQLSDGTAAMEKLHALEKPKFISTAVHWGQGRVYGGLGPNFVPVAIALEGPDAGTVKRDTLFHYIQPRYLADVADCVTEKADWCLLPGDGVKAAHEQALTVYEGDFSAVVMPQRMGDTPPSDKARKPASKAAKASKPTPEAPPAGKPAPEAATGSEKTPKPAPVAPKAGNPPPVAPEAAKPPKTGPKPATPAPAGQPPAKRPEKAPKAPAKPAEPVKVPPARRSLKPDPAK